MIRKILQIIVCSFSEKRCVFCDREICAVHPNGNPYIDSDYRKAMEHVEQLRTRTQEQR